MSLERDFPADRLTELSVNENHMETTQDLNDFPIVQIAVDGSGRIFIMRNEPGASWYFTPLAGWRTFVDVPMKDVPPDDGTTRDRFVWHDERWWPDAAAALLMVKAIGKYL